MKVLMFYRPDSEQARMVEEFMHEYNRTHPGSEVTVIDVDSKDGASKVEVYDVMRYPTMVATADDGTELQRWDGDVLPLMSEVAYYANL